MEEYIFKECVNDLWNYFIIGDPVLLSGFQQAQHLSNDLITEFTTNNSIDKAVEDGIIIPLSGIENYPYTIYFKVNNLRATLEKDENNLQFKRTGYVLRIENRQLYLYTIPYLKDWTEGIKKLVANPTKPRIRIENGWYEVTILGGETKQGNEWEPTLEFLLQKTEEKPAYMGDIHFQFTIESRDY